MHATARGLKHSCKTRQDFIDGISAETPLIDDDRATLLPGDMVLLIIEDDPDFAGILRDFAREKGFKTVVASTVHAAVALARELHPSAITLDLHLPDNDGWLVLDQLKHDSETRHIPIHIISADEERERSLRLGAVSHFQKPVTRAIIDQALSQTIDFINRPLKNLLIIEDNANERQAPRRAHRQWRRPQHRGRVRGRGLRGTRQDALRLHRAGPRPARQNGLELIREIHQSTATLRRPSSSTPPRYSPGQEETELRLISDSIVIKNARSPERLLDETALFLHRVQTQAARGQAPHDRAGAQERFRAHRGRKVLVVTTMSATSSPSPPALEALSHEGQLRRERPGRDRLSPASSDMSRVVLMDVMMPDMDGFEAIRRIRAIDRFKKLPIISVTAKAMRGDREKCLEAGASDYITKPVDMDQLRSLLRVWLYR